MVCLDMPPTENVGDVPFISDIYQDNISVNMGSNTCKKVSSYYGSNQETEILLKSDPPISDNQKQNSDFAAATPTASLTPMS